LNRVRSAITLPIIVFPLAAVIAIGIGMFLHLVRDLAMESHSPLEVYATPIAALILVLVITIGGFIASGLAGPSPE